jgi:hypothetical protein
LRREFIVITLVLMTLFSADVYSQENSTATPGASVVSSTISRIIGIPNWFITRDYGALAMNTLSWVMGWSIIIKIVIVLIIIIGLLLIWNYYFRDTRSNNLRRARTHHLNGERAHERGDEEAALMHYEEAARFRDKAQEQW